MGLGFEMGGGDDSFGGEGDMVYFIGFLNILVLLFSGLEKVGEGGFFFSFSLFLITLLL